MRILCGTDFTPAAGAAAEAARALVARTGGALRLVHVDDSRDASSESAEGSPTCDVARLFGNPDEAIVAEADRIRADLIVVGALGRRSRPRWRLGSTADRIAQHAHCPVLVVRDAEPFLRWAEGAPLKVAVGLDAGESADALVRGLGTFTEAGPCSLIGVHVYWPPEARERLGLNGGLPLGSGNTEVDTAIERVLRTSLPSASGGKPIELRIVGGLGRIADHLIQIAQDANADVVAVGSHQRAGFDRLWHGSISHGVIDGAPMSVLCIPRR